MKTFSAFPVLLLLFFVLPGIGTSLVFSAVPREPGFARESISGAPPRHNRLSSGDSIDVLHYGLHLRIPGLTTKYIQGEAVLLIVPRVSGLETFGLDLLHLQVDSVLVNGTVTGFTYNDSLLRVWLPAAISVTDTLELKVHYQGIPVIDPGFWGLPSQLRSGLVSLPR
jgi:hypothetical protein